MAISAARVQVLVWVLIYGGLFAVAVGWSLRQGGEDWGIGVAIGGLVLVVAGAVLVWVRSRMPADRPAND